MKVRYGITIIIWTWLVCLGSVGFVAAKAVQMDLRGNKLSLKAENVPLERILQEVEKLTSIKMHYSSLANHMVSVDLDNISLVKGIELLVRDYNHSVIYERSGVDGNLAIRTLFVFSASNEHMRRNAGGNYSKKLTNREKPKTVVASYKATLAIAALQHNIPPENDPLTSVLAMGSQTLLDDHLPIFRDNLLSSGTSMDPIQFLESR